MTGQTIADRVSRERRASLRGRETELAQLKGMLREDGPVVAWVHGPPGIGKTALVRGFEAALDDEGVERLRVEAGAVEPRPDAILATLASLLACQVRDVAGFATEIAARGTVFLTVDDVDTWRLAESWLRLDLVPRLPASMRLVFAGRAAPLRHWSEFGDLFLEVRLGPLRREDVSSLAADLPPGVTDRVWAASGGHPWAARLAIYAARTGTLSTTWDAGEVVWKLLHAIDDAALRQATEACAVVRRASLPLVAEMLGVDQPTALGLLAQIEALPFASRDAEGLSIAEPVRRTIVERVSGLEPDRYALWRRRAADWIVARLRSAGPRDRWRHMADLLHLLEQPALRDAFFPPEGSSVAVEPVRPEDHAAILRLTEHRHGPDEKERIALWLARVPHRFKVVRNAAAEVTAYYLHARPDDPLDGLAANDPLFAAWLEHLAEHPVRGEVLFVRQMLARASDAPERLACNLDLKRNYIERWGLARIYTCAMEEALAGPLLHSLGFRPLHLPRDGLPGSMVLDLPGADLIGWVSALVGATDRQPAAEFGGFDFVRDRREIRAGGHAATLTRLEAEVLAALIDAAPNVVGREALIEQIWRRAFVGSNVVDTVVRTLRKKLGPMRECVQTVPKTGYRYVPPT